MITSQDTCQIAEWITNAASITAFTGAGISTPSGIPDFRSPDSGLWEDIDEQQVASLSGFRRDARPFYTWIRPLLQQTHGAQPNAAHLALVELEQLGKLDSIITQNIDMLHTRAGSSTVYELHGHLREMTCIQCATVYPADSILQQVIDDGNVPRCDKCGGILKPNIILFGEELPRRPLQEAKRATATCDIMLVIGSSLEVQPANQLPIIAKQNGAKLIIINKQPTLMDHRADKVIHGDAAEILPAIVQCVNKSL